MVTQDVMSAETLTGLLSPESALRQLELQIQRAKTARRRVGVVHAAISIPGLHTGMEQAELEAQVMRILAYRLTTSIRATDPAAQMGPRELLVILPGLHTPEDGLTVAEGVVRSLRHPLSVSNRLLQTGVNAGVAVSGAHGHTAEKLLECARESVFEARKRPGKGTFMAPWKLSERMLGGLRKHHVEKTDSRRRDDSRDWTGPRSER